MSTVSSAATDLADQSLEERYAQALTYLYGRINYERAPDTARGLSDFKLQRMEALLNELGNPQLQVPTVHIAGSKGKGSTATMVARIAQASGIRVGLFTSPHVTRFEERFTINGEVPGPREVLELFEQVRAVAQRFDQRGDGERLTFFELATAMGWLHFVRNRVDLGVIEVGLGGRLDSTNVCSPLVTVITSISRDHMRLLGNTLESIAREKAGIVKPGVPVVTSVAETGPAEVIAGIAAEKSAPLFRLGIEISARPRRAESVSQAMPLCHEFDFTSPWGNFSRLQPGMPGEHQVRNGALATATALLLRDRGYGISDEAIRQGLNEACCAVRVQTVSTRPLMIVDAAHNPASMEALCETLRTVQGQRRIVIFASSRDKEVGALLAVLNGQFDEIWLTRYQNHGRGMALPDLETLARETLSSPWRSFSTPAEALDAARAAMSPDDLLCVTGSFFLAAEIQDLLAAAS